MTKRFLALILTMMMLLSAACAERIDFVLEGLGEPIRIQAGSDEKGLSGFELKLGDGVALTISGDGLRMDSGEQSIGISPEVLAEAFWMQALGVNSLPDASGEDGALVMGLLGQLWQEMTANTLTVQTQPADGHMQETTYTLQLQTLLKNTDQAVEKLLTQNAAELDALFVKYAELIGTVLGVSGQELKSSALLEGWQQLSLSELLPMEIPLILKVKGSGDLNAPWSAAVFAPGVIAEAEWTGQNFSAEFSLGGQTYAFDSADFAWLFSQLEKLPEYWPADALFVDESHEGGMYSLHAHLNPMELLNASMHGLGALLHSQPAQTEAFLARYIPWMELLGMYTHGLTADSLVDQLIGYDAYREATYPRLYRALVPKVGDFDFQLTCGRYGSLPLSLSLAIGTNSLALFVDESSLNAEVLEGGRPVFTFSGWVNDYISEAILSCGGETYRLILENQEDWIDVSLTAGRGNVLLTGTISENGFVFETPQGAYGSLSMTDSEMRFNLYDGYRFSSAALRLIGEEWQLDADVLGEHLRLRLSPDRFAVSGPFLLEMQLLPGGGFHAQTHFDETAAMLEISSAGLYSTLHLPRTAMEIRLTETGLLFDWQDPAHEYTLLASAVKPEQGGDFALSLSYSGETKMGIQYYEGLLSVTELDNGVRLELVSEEGDYFFLHHDPITCTITAADEPFSSPAPENCLWLSAPEAREYLFGL